MIIYESGIIRPVTKIKVGKDFIIGRLSQNNDIEADDPAELAAILNESAEDILEEGYGKRKGFERKVKTNGNRKFL